MINVAGHLREQNGTYQMILSWKDTTGKRRTKSISTGLPVKGNKKRAESLLRQTQKEFNPETMQQVCDLPVSEYFTRWLRESVMSLPPETYGRYAYDMGKVIMPYFEKKQLSLKALAPRDLETFFRYERQQEEATVQQLLDWHKELSDAFQYAIDSNWLKVNPIKEVDPCLDNSPVLFTDFFMDWLKMMKSRVAITTYANYEIVITRRIIPYFKPFNYTLQDLEQHPKYIQDFYQHELDRGVTANTVIHYHANIRKCLQYAFQIGMIRSNPADRVERPRKEKFKSEVYKAEELEQLFKVIQGDPSEFGVIMAAFYGLRRSEIVGLKWDAIDFEFLSSSSIWCHPVISSDIWFPLCKGKIHASTNNNLKYPRFFDAFFLYSVFSVWTAQMEIGGMFRRDAGQNAPLLRHKTKGKSRIMNQNQAKEYYKKLFVNYPDVLSVEEATTLLGFKSQTAIIRRIHQHRIRCLKVGRSFMIPKEYLIDYLLDS